MNIFPKNNPNMPQGQFADIQQNLFEINDLESISYKNALVTKLLNQAIERQRKQLVQRSIKNRIMKKLITVKKGAPRVDYEAIKLKIPQNMSPNHCLRRRKIFRLLDKDNSNYLTLEECIKGVKSLFNYVDDPKLSLVAKAYSISCKITQNFKKKPKKQEDDHVDYKEFRLFLKFLQQFLDQEMIFQQIDVSGDMKLNYEEYEKAIPTLIKHGVNIDEPVNSYLEMQAKPNIMKEITFDEFLEYAYKNNRTIMDDQEKSESSSEDDD